MDKLELSESQKCNEQQRRAIFSKNKHILVQAGAGTGKTTVLIERILHLIDTGQADASEILAITFTRAAVEEIKERLSKRLLPEQFEKIWINTFHSTCKTIIENNQHLLPFIPISPPMTTSRKRSQKALGEQQYAIKRLLKAMFKFTKPKENINESTQNLHTDRINRWKQDYIFPQEVVKKYNLEDIDENFVHHLKNKNVTESKDGKEIKTLESLAISLHLYKKYQSWLKKNKLIDMNDPTIFAINMLKEHAHVREQYQKRFKHVLVDEYQDTNVVQQMFLELVAVHNLFCVGDEDQSIYGWRGAKIENIRDFHRRHHKAEVIALEDNYRSGKHILAGANDIIRHNDRYPKKLLCTKTEHHKIQITKYYGAYNEVNDIVDKILSILKEDDRLQESKKRRIAILVRNRGYNKYKDRSYNTYKIIIKNLNEHDIEYHEIGRKAGFYNNNVVQDIIAYMTLALTSVPSSKSSTSKKEVKNYKKEFNENLKRLMRLELAPNTQDVQNIAKKFMDAIHDIEKDYIQYLHENPEKIFDDDISPKTALLIKDMLKNILELRKEMNSDKYKTDQSDRSQFLETLIDKFDYKDKFAKTYSKIDMKTLKKQIEELISTGDDFKFENWEEFIENTRIMTQEEIDKEQSKKYQINISTIYGVKGLEFDIVFLPSWIEKIFPYEKNDATLPEDAKAEKMEEERRLAYVAITRAKERCYISHFGSSPSLFLQNISDKDCERKSHFKNSHSD